MTDFATVRAAALSAAPLTLHSRSLVAPSPSLAILRHRSVVTACSAAQKAAKSSFSSEISALPARPLASSATMSLVEVSPSTLTMLKESCTSAESAFCSMAGEIAASVVTKMSMVAMLGLIMPTPLPMAPMRHSLPPSTKR